MGVTLLNVDLAAVNRVVCQFRSRGGGARTWMFIVDRFQELAEEVADGTGMEPTYPDAPKMLGQGARVSMPRRHYVRLRVELEQDEEAAEALANGSFVINDAHVAPKLVLNLARAHFVRGAKEPWLIGETGEDRS